MVKLKSYGLTPTSPDISYKCIYAAVKKAVNALELEDVSVYSFKHTFATRLNELVENQTLIGKLLGHTSPPEGINKVTFRYVHP